MAAAKIAIRREQGSVSEARAQIQGQDAARGVNLAKARLDAQLLLVLAAPFTTTSQAAQPTKLGFQVKKGDLWFIEYWGFGHSAGAGGINHLLAAPPNSVISGTFESSTVNTGVANWIILTFSNTAFIGACHAGATDTGRPDRMQARVQCGADGYIALMAASVTAASKSTIDAQALMRATKYSKVYP